jgi:hypothetical protein
MNETRVSACLSLQQQELQVFKKQRDVTHPKIAEKSVFLQYSSKDVIFIPSCRSQISTTPLHHIS